MKKRVTALILVLAMVLSFQATAFAAESPAPESGLSGDVASYYDETLGCEVTLAVTDVEYTDNGYKILSVDVYEDEEFSHSLYVNPVENIIRFTYDNGTVETVAMSDVVQIEDITEVISRDELVDGDICMPEVENNAVPYATDYVANETLSVSSSGEQSTISGTSYSGFIAMGYRGGYTYAPTTYGYLQRKNAGITATSYAKKFEFSKGTAISTAATVIYDSVTGGISSAIVTVMLNALGVGYDYAFAVIYSVRTFQWNYRVCLNSNTGSVIYNTYRTQDYFRMYSETNGKVNYQYRGSAYDGGFSQSNTTMIKTAIDTYLGG